MTALSIYAMAHRYKKDPEHPAMKLPEGVAYVATFAERRAMYARAAKKAEVEAALQQLPPQTVIAHQALVAATPQASSTSALTTVPLQHPQPQQARASTAAVPLGALTSGGDKVQPRYAGSPPFSATAQAEASTALANMRATRGANFRLRVYTAENWNVLAGMHARQHGCDRATALQQVGFVHPALSVANSRR